MTEATSYRAAQLVAPRSGGRGLLLGLAIFGLLFALYIPYWQIYVPNSEDIPLLADGSLLAGGAHWQDWFTRGYSHFWDEYPEWPQSPGTEFTRPAFQFLIYLAHFAFGTNWAWYQCINLFAVAGMGVAAFYIANTVLNLRTVPSVFACMLVVLSPPVVESWLRGPAFAIEPLATLFVVGAFVAAVARRDFLCLVLLFLALFTKENAVWAPIGAAVTIMLRPTPNESLPHRAFTAAAMFLPIAIWLVFRFALFGGIGGTYATADYTPLTGFLSLTFHKLKHIHRLFVGYDWGRSDQHLLGLGPALLVYMLLSLSPLHILPETVSRVRHAAREKRWPNVDLLFLVTLWAAIALAFHLALPLSRERYATSLVVFAWPALVAEVEKHRKAIIWVGLLVCGLVSLTTASYGYDRFIVNSPVGNDEKTMRAELRQVPTATREIYLLPAAGILYANFKYVRLVLGVSAEILRVVDIRWNCGGPNNFVASQHSATDGIVNLTVTLPTCASFTFDSSSLRLNEITLINGHLYRNDTMSYEFPEAFLAKAAKGEESRFDLGQRMIVHVRPNGPARFIIQHGAPNGFARFDVP